MNGVPVASVNTVGEALEDVYTFESNLIGELRDSRIGRIRYVKPPFKINGVRISNDSKAPDKGEDTYEILKELGYNDEDIKKMYKKEIVF